eukprot:TRINITY_DN506_c0_g1_i1.p9 TRINITY_DN506_c0_g1~~TRINITY_DN506_c0_g1_i1.p9  ORF type:complete len:290 (+),score=44.92 TRINITY_DN506_c0_g1_i1:1138-2007(+)
MHKLTGAKIIKRGKGELDWDGQHDEEAFINSFEAEYVQRVVEYLYEESKKWIATMSCPEYSRKALEVIKSEEVKANSFLSKTSCKRLSEGLAEALVANHAESLVNKERTGAKELIAQKRVEDLRVLTRLLSKKPEKSYLVTDILGQYVKSRGKAIEQDKKIVEDPIEYIKKVIELKKEMDMLMTEGFEEREQFVRANDRAFKDFLIDFELAPKFLAIYIDHLMRYGLRGQESQMETFISDAFTLFKLLNSKDMFTQQHQVNFQYYYYLSYFMGQGYCRILLFLMRPRSF